MAINSKTQSDFEEINRKLNASNPAVDNLFEARLTTNPGQAELVGLIEDAKLLGIIEDTRNSLSLLGLIKSRGEQLARNTENSERDEVRRELIKQAFIEVTGANQYPELESLSVTELDSKYGSYIYKIWDSGAFNLNTLGFKINDVFIKSPAHTINKSTGKDKFIAVLKANPAIYAALNHNNFRRVDVAAPSSNPDKYKTLADNLRVELSNLDSIDNEDLRPANEIRVMRTTPTGPVREKLIPEQMDFVSTVDTPKKGILDFPLHQMEARVSGHKEKHSQFFNNYAHFFEFVFEKLPRNVRKTARTRINKFKRDSLNLNLKLQTFLKQGRDADFIKAIQDFNADAEEAWQDLYDICDAASLDPTVQVEIMTHFITIVNSQKGRGAPIGVATTWANFNPSSYPFKFDDKTLDGRVLNFDRGDFDEIYVELDSTLDQFLRDVTDTRSIKLPNPDYPKLSEIYNKVVDLRTKFVAIRKKYLTSLDDLSIFKAFKELKFEYDKVIGYHFSTELERAKLEIDQRISTFSKLHAGAKPANTEDVFDKVIDELTSVSTPVKKSKLKAELNAKKFERTNYANLAVKLNSELSDEEIVKVKADQAATISKLASFSPPALKNTVLFFTLPANPTLEDIKSFIDYYNSIETSLITELSVQKGALPNPTAKAEIANLNADLVTVQALVKPYLELRTETLNLQKQLLEQVNLLKPLFGKSGLKKFKVGSTKYTFTKLRDKCRNFNPLSKNYDINDFFKFYEDFISSFNSQRFNLISLTEARVIDLDKEIDEKTDQLELANEKVQLNGVKLAKSYFEKLIANVSPDLPLEDVKMQASLLLNQEQSKLDKKRYVDEMRKACEFNGSAEDLGEAMNQQFIKMQLMNINYMNAAGEKVFPLKDAGIVPSQLTSWSSIETLIEMDRIGLLEASILLAYFEEKILEEKKKTKGKLHNFELYKITKNLKTFIVHSLAKDVEDKTGYPMMDNLSDPNVKSELEKMFKDQMRLFRPQVKNHLDRYNEDHFETQRSIEIEMMLMEYNELRRKLHDRELSKKQFKSEVTALIHRAEANQYQEVLDQIPSLGFFKSWNPFGGRFWRNRWLNFKEFRRYKGLDLKTSVANKAKVRTGQVGWGFGKMAKKAGRSAISRVANFTGATVGVVVGTPLLAASHGFARAWNWLGDEKTGPAEQKLQASWGKGFDKVKKMYGKTFGGIYKGMKKSVNKDLVKKWKKNPAEFKKYTDKPEELRDFKFNQYRDGAVIGKLYNELSQKIDTPSIKLRQGGEIDSVKYIRNVRRAFARSGIKLPRIDINKLNAANTDNESTTAAAA